MSSAQTTRTRYHIIPVSTYLAIFAALVILTIVTVWVSYLDLGEISIYVAMFIAIIKASLVAGFFMHLKYDDRFNTVVFASSILFIGIYFSLTFADLMSRDWVISEHGNKVLLSEKPLNIQYATQEPHPKTEPTTTAALAPSQEKKLDTAAGEKLYKTYCIACHQANGQGLPGAFPPLTKSEYVTGDPTHPIQFVLHGLQGEITVNAQKFNSIMPGLGVTLTDQQISDVLTFVRSAWGNDASAVTPDQVKAVRQEHKGRTAPWALDPATLKP